MDKKNDLILELNKCLETAVGIKFKLRELVEDNRESASGIDPIAKLDVAMIRTEDLYKTLKEINELSTRIISYFGVE
ncbi:MAG: hypothetical protein WC449_05035 [Candidatus Paceibacterota bacterium]